MLLGGCDSHSSPPNQSAVEGPIAGELALAGTTTIDLASVGYQQSEYFVSGRADSYSNTSSLGRDGKWSVKVADVAAYKTRMVVYRPIDPAAFNGTVVIEWLNVSGGPDTAADWIMAHTELIRNGYAWVGVSAQKAGIDGGGVNFSGENFYLKALDPQRYGSLVHPGDKYAFDIFSQSAQATLHPGTVDPLAGLHAQRAIAVGVSQSADFMVTYVNAIAPIKKIFDAYLIHSRFRGTVGLNPPTLTPSGIDFLARPSALIRDDLDVPVLMVQTETDVLNFGAYSERQPDTANFRLWEIAGAAHADVYVAITGRGDLGNDPSVAAVSEISLAAVGCDKPVNSGPQHFIAKTAVAALDNWIRNGVAPAYADRLDVDESTTTFRVDSVGNVLGGIRTPYVDAPIAKLSGGGQSNNSIICSLFGTTQLFDNTQLASLYPDHATFTSSVNTSVDNAINQGFLLQPDGDLIKTWAQTSTIGGP